jgi:hypothetical protein
VLEIKEIVESMKDHNTLLQKQVWAGLQGFSILPNNSGGKEGETLCMGLFEVTSQQCRWSDGTAVQRTAIDNFVAEKGLGSQYTNHGMLNYEQ